VHRAVKSGKAKCQVGALLLYHFTAATVSLCPVSTMPLPFRPSVLPFRCAVVTFSCTVAVLSVPFPAVAGNNRNACVLK